MTIRPATAADDERRGWTLVPGSETTGEHWRPRAPAVRYERHG